MLWRTPDQECRVVDLARAVPVTPGGITRIVARLQERGWSGGSPPPVAKP
jgi:DNA-binding MarR family transcriptional regulator